MPTLEHNGLVEMFREKPALAPHFLKLLFGVKVPAHESVRVADSSLDQLTPVEFRADLVLELRDDQQRIVLAIVLEAQREKAPRKKYTWLVYAAVARAERECPALVLVLAPDAEVAAWAAESIEVGPGFGAVTPLVLGPATVPEVTDSIEATKEVELSILSALAHGNGPNGLPIVEAALVALGGLDPDHAGVYFHIVYKALREPMRRAVEALAMEHQTEEEGLFPPFMQKIFDKAELKGKAEGKREGKREGELEGKRDALLRLLARAGIALREEEAARIRDCTDVAELDRWVVNVLGAKTAEDVFSRV